LAPDGNGGLYKALRFSGCVDDMQRRGVEHLHIYGIDNVLTRSLDPVFFGLCIDQGVEVGNKVVWRANKAERVGVTAHLDGHMHILEYSEIPASLAEVEDERGKLVFGAANICNHYVSVAFLIESVFPKLSTAYHLAKKKIHYYNPATKSTETPDKVNGVKLEMYIFDPFPFAIKWAVAEVIREEEFAPVKNEPGNPSDSPDTARALVNDLAQTWLKKAGAIISDPSGLYEIPPTLSYAGEGLEEFSGKVVKPGVVQKES
jgi:UDP-N-acetylglucosamine/UDP-N-acetylgalactosamine diphosphorylase